MLSRVANGTNEREWLGEQKGPGGVDGEVAGLGGGVTLGQGHAWEWPEVMEASYPYLASAVFC